MNIYLLGTDDGVGDELRDVAHWYQVRKHMHLNSLLILVHLSASDGKCGAYWLLQKFTALLGIRGQNWTPRSQREAAWEISSEKKDRRWAVDNMKEVQLEGQEGQGKGQGQGQEGGMQLTKSSETRSYTTVVKDRTLEISDTNISLNLSSSRYAFHVQGKGVLKLKNVDLQKSGIWCERGGEVILEDVSVFDAPDSGIYVDGYGKVTFTRGEIKGTVRHNGVTCRDGGKVELEDVAISDCSVHGVLCVGMGSEMRVEGTDISSSRTFNGVYCGNDGKVILTNVHVRDCKRSAVYCTGEKANVEISGGSLSSSKSEHGVWCKYKGSKATVRNVNINNCMGYGLFTEDDGSAIIVEEGCTFAECAKGNIYICGQIYETRPAPPAGRNGGALH